MDSRSDLRETGFDDVGLIACLLMLLTRRMRLKNTDHCCRNRWCCIVAFPSQNNKLIRTSSFFSNLQAVWKVVSCCQPNWSCLGSSGPICPMAARAVQMQAHVYVQWQQWQHKSRLMRAQWQQWPHILTRGESLYWTCGRGSGEK